MLSGTFFGKAGENLVVSAEAAIFVGGIDSVCTELFGRAEKSLVLGYREFKPGTLIECIEIQFVDKGEPVYLKDV
ncbi:hypothetical protein SAMN04487988_11668, partial [Algoriphagus hitonicola]